MNLLSSDRRRRRFDLRRFRDQLVIVALTPCVVVVLGSTAWAAEAAAEHGADKLVMALATLCGALVLFMGGVVKLLRDWLRKVEPTLPRRDPQRDGVTGQYRTPTPAPYGGQDILGRDDEIRILREKVRRYEEREALEERQRNHENRVDQRLDGMEREMRAVKEQSAATLASAARTAKAVEDLAKRLPGSTL